jgi:deoxycytidine triphosphate deaminase
MGETADDLLGDLAAGDRAGVLPSQHLRAAIAAGWLDAGDFKIPEEQIQPASLDLRLGPVAYRIRCSFLPDTETVERKVKDYILDEIDLSRDGAVLERNCPYLIPLRETLALPDHVRAVTVDVCAEGDGVCERGRRSLVAHTEGYADAGTLVTPYVLSDLSQRLPTVLGPR